MLPKKKTVSHERSRVWIFSGILGLLLGVIAVQAWLNRRIYPPVSSGTSLVLIKQLYTACNTKNVTLLDKFENRLKVELKAQEVTDQEAEHFQAIVQTARAGDWDASMKRAYRFARDQRTDY